MEEDGRLGNLLIETATLFLIGRQANVTVSLLPQVISAPHSLDFQKICTGGEKAFKPALPAASGGDRSHEALHLHQVHGLHLPGVREVDKSALLEVPP